MWRGGPRDRESTKGTDRNKKRSTEAWLPEEAGAQDRGSRAAPKKNCFPEACFQATCFGPLDPDHSCAPNWDINTEAGKEAEPSRLC